MQNTVGNERFTALDGWRGIAALMVAVFHFNVFFHGFHVPVVRNGYLFVDFFFVLSGFVIAHATRNKLTGPDAVADFAARRLWRVWPLHVFMLALFVALELFRTGLITLAHVAAHSAPFDPEGPMPASQILPHLLLTHALGTFPRLTWNHPSWSIAAEYWTYLIFAAVTLLAGRLRLPVLGLIAGVSALVLVSSATDGMNAAQDFGVLRCLFGFVTGVVVYEFRQGRVLNWAGVLEIPVLIGVLVYVGLAGRGPMSFAAPLVFAVPVLVFSYEQGPLSGWLRRKPVQWLGSRSYSIYMVHVFVLTIMNLAVSGLQMPLLHRDVFEVLPVLGRQITGLPPLLADALLALYLATVLLLANWTFVHVETPGRKGIMGLYRRRGTAEG